ncbi:RNA pyrophosphohydrolase [Pontiellaceae bacterium B1224]|nr:RNA pyrophosphohydrolase [Pontiellaceae bacterium B1224]
MDADRKKLLKKWRSNLKDSQIAHYRTAEKFKRLNYYLGIPVIAFSVFVSSNMFSELQSDQSSTRVEVGIGLVGVLAAILASIQTFLRFPERAEIHRSMGVKFSLLKKDVDKFLALHAEDNSGVDEGIEEIKSKWDEIVTEAPTVSNKLWSKVKSGSVHASPLQSLFNRRTPEKPEVELKSVEIKRPDNLFRGNVAGMIINKKHEVLALERADIEGAWQMPQGGLKEGEATRDAVFREIEEETGIGRDDLNPLAEHPDWLAYELSEKDRIGKHGRGQVQKWFLFEFTGTDADIQIEKGDHPEFRAWRWMSLPELTEIVASFRKPIYEKLGQSFSKYIQPQPKAD